MKISFLIALNLVAAHFAFGQSGHKITLNLGDGSTDKSKPTMYSSENQRIEHVILNSAFSNVAYSIMIEATPVAEPSLNYNGATSSGSTCTQLEAKYTETKDMAALTNQSEKDLKKKLKELSDLQESSDCNEPGLLGKIAILRKNTVRTVALPIPVEMKSNYDYEIIVTGGKDKLYFKFAGKSKGRILTSYGFLFSSKGIEPRQYFSDNVGADSFRITRRRAYNVMDLRFAPTIFFSYVLNKNLQADWVHSFSAGLGFNTASPVVSLGYTGLFNTQFGFSTGIVFYEHQRLDGRYREGQIIKENLDSDKLHEKLLFRPNLYFSINLRLGENPFKADKKKDED